MASKSSNPEERTAEQKKPGVSWSQDEEHIIPKNRLGIVSFALVCTMFLAALDNTIVTTALPTIVTSLQGGTNYIWVGNAYILAVGAFGPFYGKLSDMFGRKQILYSCIVIFLSGSALCGAAQGITWLIVCRAFQGIGGGGIMQLSFIVISDIVPLKDRARYTGIVGGTYSIASVSGPLFGGALAQHASWRWCFFINLPIGAIAIALLFFFLNVHPPQRRPLRTEIAELDFVGLFSLVPGIVCLLLGFTFGEDSWLNPYTISFLVVGMVLLIVGGVNQAFTKRAAIVPPRLFKTRTTGCLLAVAFLQNGVFMTVMFYLPLYYQALGSSATVVGVKMLPYTFVTSTFMVLAGFVVSKMGKTRPALWFGSTLFTTGTGIMIMLDSTSTAAEQVLFPLMAAIGMAFLFSTPLVALQAAMPHKNMATATSGYMFLRTLGGAVALAVGDAILSGVLSRKLVAIPNIAQLGLELGGGSRVSAATLINNVNQLHSIPDVGLRDAVLHAFARSIATIWIVMTGWAGLSLVLTLFLREYSVERKTVYSGESKNSDASVGKSELVMLTEGMSAEVK